MENFTVYILESIKTGKKYIGHTYDIRKRLQQHNVGISKATRASKPWKLIYTESGFKTRGEAIRREKQIKSWKGGNKLRDLLQQAGIV